MTDELRKVLEALEYYRSGEDYQPTPASEAIAIVRAELERPDAVLAEREACAKIADDMDFGLGELAAAIRGRG